MKKQAVCIGKFDGLHKGHQKILQNIMSDTMRSVMVTFEFPGTKTILTRDEKIKTAKEYGIHEVMIIPFTKEFRETSAKDFIEQVLIKELHTGKLAAGSDFCFGKNRLGNVDLLKTYQDEFQLIQVEKEEFKNETISSTRIREHITKGNMEEAACMLGRNYFISGEVVRGNQIGRTLDMPTANQLVLAEKVLPPKGVYAARIRRGDGSQYYGVANLGQKPTIPGENKMGLETYFFDFDQDIYGEDICVELCHFLRPECKFANLDELKNQMMTDRHNARKKLSQ